MPEHISFSLGAMLHNPVLQFKVTQGQFERLKAHHQSIMTLMDEQETVMTHLMTSIDALVKEIAQRDLRQENLKKEHIRCCETKELAASAEQVEFLIDRKIAKDGIIAA